MKNYLNIIENKLKEKIKIEDIKIIDNSKKHKHHKFFDPEKEFIPQKLNNFSLINARKSPPVSWIWKNNQIKRLMFNPLVKKLQIQNERQIDMYF